MENEQRRARCGGAGWSGVAVRCQCGGSEEAKHLAWLQNIVDTAALKFIAGKQEVLYMEELAELITQHYQDILEDPEDVPDAEWLSDDEEEE